MATMQESLKASSGVDVKELLENLSGKRNIRQSLDDIKCGIEKSKGYESGITTVKQKKAVFLNAV